MPGIIVGSNESINSALKRFKKQVEKGGVLFEIKKREFYEKPSQRKKKRLFASKKRFTKTAKRT
jgi:small subunit ribosomal protein S21